MVRQFSDLSARIVVRRNIFWTKDLGWVNPWTHLQGWFLLEAWQNEGHAHGKADEGGWHDDLAQDPLLVPLAVVEPLDLQGGHML